MSEVNWKKFSDEIPKPEKRIKTSCNGKIAEWIVNEDMSLVDVDPPYWIIGITAFRGGAVWSYSVNGNGEHL